MWLEEEQIQRAKQLVLRTRLPCYRWGFWQGRGPFTLALVQSYELNTHRSLAHFRFPPKGIQIAKSDIALWCESQHETGLLGDSLQKYIADPHSDASSWSKQVSQASVHSAWGISQREELSSFFSLPCRPDKLQQNCENTEDQHNKHIVHSPFYLIVTL